MASTQSQLNMDPFLLLQLPCLQENSLAYPRPQRVLPRNQRGQQPNVQSSALSASLHIHNNSLGSSSEVELLEIMLKPANEQTPSFLGVSPPVRSGCFGGAANPWSHDRSWKMSAYSASSTNLQALRELDSEGESFLKAKESSAGMVVLGMDERLPDPADCSDAGSDTTAVNECAPFTCHTEYFLH